MVAWVLKTSVVLMMLCLLSGNRGLGCLRRVCGGIFYKQGTVVGGIWVILQVLPRYLCRGRI